MTDALGHIADYDYDTAGHLIQFTAAKGTTDQIILRYEYDISGNKTAEIDAKGNRTHYQYDGMNRLLKTQSPQPRSPFPIPSHAPKSHANSDRP